MNDSFKVDNDNNCCCSFAGDEQLLIFNESLGERQIDCHYDYSG